MNSIRLLLLLSVSVAQAHSKDKTQGTRVGDFVNKQSCDGNFDVQLTTVSGDTLKASCPGSYSRCPFAKTSNDWNDPDKCLGSPGDWTSESGRSLDYVESHTFGIKNNAKPLSLYVNDLKGETNCARAFYQNQYIDFALGNGNLDLSGWWNGEPLQMSIVPFSGTCDGSSVDDFNAERLLAVWISPYLGQQENPKDGSVYCDLSDNPEDCLNFPYWSVEKASWDASTYELVLHGTLSKVLSSNPSAVNIFLPQGYELGMPINNLEVRFEIFSGYHDKCQAYIDGDTSAECLINKWYVAADVTESQIIVSGIGRINGWDAMTTQREYNYWMNCGDPDKYCSAGNGGQSPGLTFNDPSLDWEGFAQWYISGQLLNLSSNKPGFEYGNDNFALDVSGVEVVWGAKYGYSPFRLNVIDDQTYDYPAKIYDAKYLSFNDQGDGFDLSATGSYTDFTFSQTNDDNMKPSSKNCVRKHSTMIQGHAGCAINLSAYGWGDIDGTLIDGVYIHRLAHAASDIWNGCGNGYQSWGDGYGGLICSRSCAHSWTTGLRDTTISGLYVPEIGDANSVSRLFAIGVNEDGMFCDSNDARAQSYNIQNLVIKDSEVYPNPGCDSIIFDDTGVVNWGNPSITFFDESASDPKQCDFQGALSISSDPQYFVCGFDDQAEAEKYCMTTDGVGGETNVEYAIVSGDNPNINFPTCGYSSMAVAVE